MNRKSIFTHSLLLITGLFAIALVAAVTPSLSWARGFGGGFHGGGFSGGGFHGAAGFGGAGFGGASFHGANFHGANFHGANFHGTNFHGAGSLGNLNANHFHGANFGGLNRNFSGMGNLGSQLGHYNFGGGHLGNLDANHFSGSNAGGFGNGRVPSRSQLSNYLGLPSDNGLHGLSGETQSRLSQAEGKIRSGDSQFRNDLSGETQSRMSQIYDNARAGDGSFKNYIPGETQKPLSRMYDQYKTGNHPYHPISPWHAHNNSVVIRNNFNTYNMYTGGWYRRYPGAWYPPAWAYGDAWRYAPWGTLGLWLGCAPGAPIYYDYGNNVVYQDNSVYVNGQDAGTQEQYYQQAQGLAEAGTKANLENSKDWMPLGVFALSEAGQTSANLTLQLAVNKQGIIRGNYTNTNTSKIEPVQGSVDKKTERAAWTVGQDTKTVYDTGIYNLTKDQTTVMVHTGDKKEKQILLVRLKQKDEPVGD